MPAAKGNRNGAVAWFRTTGVEEKPIKKYIRVSQQLEQKVNSLLTGDETFSDFARAAIEAEIERRKK